MTKRKRNFKQNKPVKFAKYGNWCGPGWTAGQSKNADDMSSSDYNVPSVNGIDAACKQHDIAIHEASNKRDVEKANLDFVMDASGQGYTGKIMGQLVDWFGPSDVSAAKKDPHFSKSIEGKKHTAKRLKMVGVRSEQIDPSIRHIIPVDDPMGSENLRTAATSSSRIQSNNEGETAVDMLPTLTYLPFKNTQQCFMKLRHLGTLSPALGTVGSTSCVADTYRLNSIYDCRSEYAFVADPTASADVVDLTINTPHMRSYWMSFYRYWTVTKTYYRIKFWTTSTSSTGEIILYLYKHGQQYPPVRNYLADTRIEHFTRKNHPNMVYYKIHTPNTTETDFNLYQDKVQIAQGSWVPGSITNTVAEDELSETWHKATEVPSHRQLLTIMAQRSERSENKAYVINYEIELAYEVQLKDLKAEHEFVTSDSAIPAIAGYYAQGN